MLASAIIEMLHGEPGLSVVHVVRTGTEALRFATQETISVVLIDYRLSKYAGH